MKKKSMLNKLLIIVFLIISSNSFSNYEFFNQIEYKTINLTPDLNKDGTQDKLVVDYYETEDKVYTRISPYIDDKLQDSPIYKVFDKNTFGDEFSKYTKNYIIDFYNKYSDKSSFKHNVESSKAVLTDFIEENSETIFEDEKNLYTEENLLEKNIELNENNETETETTGQKEKKVLQVNEKFISGEYEYVEYYVKEIDKRLTFDYKFDKYVPKNLDDFVMIKNVSNIREKPTTSSKIVETSKFPKKYRVIGKVNDSTGKSGQWYEIELNGKLAYIYSANVIKREYDWNDMMKRVDKFNKFVQDSLDLGKIIYVLDDYVPLTKENGTFKDKFGNRENQSERGYLSSNFKGEYINIPDRSLMIILEETNSYIKVKIDEYDGIYYLKKNTKKYLKDSKITGVINKFIYVDRNSQNEIVIERDKDTNKYNVVTASFVTTGKDGGSSYATPYGAFLIAYAKPVMQYVGSDSNEIVGDAKNAIRFSGGGYMHSIPSLFEPKETREQRKAATARKIGTYAESHKCIRHYDDQIKFIYDWLGNSTPKHKYGYRYPSEPTVMLVK